MSNKQSNNALPWNLYRALFQPPFPFQTKGASQVAVDFAYGYCYYWVIAVIVAGDDDGRMT